jgi:dipeptidyl aminopeptidase/acylaminoacyl peptidase
MIPLAKLAPLAAIVILASACSGSTASSTSPSASAPTVSPTAVASASKSPIRPSVEPSIAVLDGEPWIVYAGYQPGKQTKDLFLVRADGADAHVIVTEVPGVHAAPSWSPDGTRIAFVNRDEATPSGSIWIANAYGSAPAMLTDGGGACPDGIFHPNWSPDGSKLAVICYPDPGGTQDSVATYDLATMAARVDWSRATMHAPSAPTPVSRADPRVHCQLRPTKERPGTGEIRWWLKAMATR